MAHSRPHAPTRTANNSVVPCALPFRSRVFARGDSSCVHSGAEMNRRPEIVSMVSIGSVWLKSLEGFAKAP
eukprot:6672648-Prymnesium_polylepis.1